MIDQFGKFMKLPAVMQETGLGKSEIYKRISKGQFPRQVSIGGKAVAWLESEIAHWKAQRVAESRAK